VHDILNDLINSQDGIDSIKKYFYDFLDYTNDNGTYKGCLLTNCVDELEGNEVLTSEITQFAAKIFSVFKKKLAMNTNKNVQLVEKQANFLIVALQGLSVASKMLNKKQLNDFIEETFNHL
jgi:TetR/AcrR family transcriptional repressor of nem operon